MSRTRTAPIPRAERPRPTRLGAGAVSLGRILAIGVVAATGAVPLAAAYVALRDVLYDGTVVATTHGPYHTWAFLGLLLLSLTVVRMRWVTHRTRQLVGRWCGVAIPEPYRPAPRGPRVNRWERLSWVLSDPATWRDLLWTGLNAVGVFLLLLLPLGALAVSALGRLLFRPLDGPTDHPTPPTAPAAPAPPAPPAPPAGSGQPLYGPMHGLLHADKLLLGLWLLLCLLLAVAVLRSAPRLLAG